MSIISARGQEIDVAPLINLNELEPSYETDIIELYEFDDSKNNNLFNKEEKNPVEPFVTISLLNKITAEVNTFNIDLKKNYLYEELNIYAIDCYNSDPLEKQETAAYLNVYNQLSMKKLFNGWMIKSLPSISSLEHPVYDLWVDNCNKL